MYTILIDESDTGIYCIRNILNNKRYIGRALSLNKRKIQHFNDLLKGIHANIHLQNSYNKYGSDNFIFETIEIVKDIKEIANREQYWITYYYNTSCVYNISLKVEKLSVLGKPLLQIDKDTNEVIDIWINLTQASNALGINKNSISKVCRGQLKTAGNYEWQFLYEPVPVYKPLKRTKRKKIKSKLMTSKDDIMDFI